MSRCLAGFVAHLTLAGGIEDVTFSPEQTRPAWRDRLPPSPDTHASETTGTAPDVFPGSPCRDTAPELRSRRSCKRVRPLHATSKLPQSMSGHPRGDAAAVRAIRRVRAGNGARARRARRLRDFSWQPATRRRCCLELRDDARAVHPTSRTSTRRSVCVLAPGSPPRRNANAPRRSRDFRAAAQNRQNACSRTGRLERCRRVSDAARLVLPTDCSTEDAAAQPVWGALATIHPRGRE